MQRNEDGSYSHRGYTITRSTHGGWEVRWWGTLVDRLRNLQLAMALARRMARR